MRMFSLIETKWLAQDQACHWQNKIKMQVVWLHILLSVHGSWLVGSVITCLSMTILLDANWITSVCDRLKLREHNTNLGQRYILQKAYLLLPTGSMPYMHMK